MARTMLRPRKRKARRSSPVIEQAGMTAAEVAAQAGIQARTIAFYISEGLLPSPRFRGPATRYDREHLLRVVAIKKLQRDEKLSLSQVKRRLKTMTREQLEELARAELAKSEAMPSQKDATPAGAAEGAPARASASTAMTSWERLEILPGLELFVRSNVSPHVRRVVREIEAQFAANGPVSAERRA